MPVIYRRNDGGRIPVSSHIYCVSAIIIAETEAYMAVKYAQDELNKCSKQELITIILMLQEQISQLNDNVERLIEQIRIANNARFGRRSERMDVCDGQLSFFNEAEAISDPAIPEPDPAEVLPRKPKRRKGQRTEDLKGLPEESHSHSVSREKLDEFFGKDNWRKMLDEHYQRLRYEPASWTVENHTVEVYVGTGGLHQDEFMRGDRPKDLIRNSIVTPSLGAAILNAKYVNSLPLYRIEQEFERNDVHINRQTMANWVITIANRYLDPMYRHLKNRLLTYHVNQADETPVNVIRDGRPAGTDSYMWVHRSGEFYRDKPIVLYEYQMTRHHDHPREWYRDFKGILVTDGLQQYHMLENELPGIRSANCWAHARRDFADACKAIGKKNQELLKNSIAHQALEKIAKIYKLEGDLKELTATERLRRRKEDIRPLVDDFFKWANEQLETTLPKGKTAEGLRYCLNQEKYLRVFLTDGNVPIDNGASERSIRTFCIGKKNWVLIDSIKGAKASATVYSISETAKLNNLNPYYYFNHLLSELPKRIDKDGNIEPDKLEDLLPWSKKLPAKCYKPRR